MSSSDPPPRDAPERARLRLGLGAAVTLGLVVLSAVVGWGVLRGQAAPADAIALDDPAASSTAEGVVIEGGGGEVYVHVLGEVVHPGLYILPAGARLVDALAAAGGARKTADLGAVNLARPVSDGEQVVVPAPGADPSSGGASPGAPPGAADGLVDLNTADQSALEELPRIGPALAQRIIDWREQNGRFRSVDDLLAVPGIGEKLLAGLREKARV